MSKSKYIYGVSSRYSFRQWKHYVYVFETQQAAENWLNTDTEQYDFSEREILKNKTAAVKLAGRKAVEQAEELIAMNDDVYK